MNAKFNWLIVTVVAVLALGALYVGYASGGSGSLPNVGQIDVAKPRLVWFHTST